MGGGGHSSTFMHGGGSHRHLHDGIVKKVADVQVPISVKGEAPRLAETAGATGGPRHSVSGYPIASNSGDKPRGNVDLRNVCNAMHIKY